MRFSKAVLLCILIISSFSYTYAGSCNILFSILPDSAKFILPIFVSGEDSTFFIGEYISQETIQSEQIGDSYSEKRINNLFDFGNELDEDIMLKETYSSIPRTCQKIGRGDIIFSSSKDLFTNGCLCSYISLQKIVYSIFFIVSIILILFVKKNRKEKIIVSIGIFMAILVKLLGIL